MATEGRVHTFHAEASVLSAELRRPLQQDVKPQAFVSLPGKGGYLSERAEDYRLEGVISFESAYTQVAGNQSLKPGLGWVTLATSVIEGLNVLDVVTADRVVAQISTEHPLAGYVPGVTFLGTRFENLKIAGHQIKPRFNLEMCGPKPEGDKLYLADGAFRGRVSDQHNRLSEAAGLPDSVKSSYRGKLPDGAQLQKQWEEFIYRKGSRPEAAVECSLVDTVDETRPWNSAGHVIDVPHFGKIFLAELRVDCDSFQLTMIHLEMGCIAHGSGKVGMFSVNGTTKP
jgi:hypothetical protein